MGKYKKKLMYDWVNTRHQKTKMEQVAKLPCCGKDEETRILDTLTYLGGIHLIR